MRRVLVFFAAAIVFFGTAHLRANAMSEICPAQVQIARVSPVSPSAFHDAGETFAVRLRAETPRSIGGTITFYTDKGWYSAVLPHLTLNAVGTKYSGILADFTVHEAYSQSLRIRFPQVIKVREALLTDVTSDDPMWSSRGKVTCLNDTWPLHQIAVAASQFVRTQFPTNMDSLPKPADPWPSPETPPATINATQAAPLGDVSCAAPFSEALALNVIVPRYPVAAPLVRRATSTVAVVLDEEGVVRDAWVIYPSGFVLFDTAALDAARSSKYQHAVSLCTPVASEYLFSVIYESGL